MKFTAFVLATAAATAAAQPFANPFAAIQGTQFIQPAVSQVNPYVVAQPQYQPYPVAQPYPVVQPQVVDPLAWERDCTWINSIRFRQQLSQATCGADVCTQPKGNGGGHRRQEVGDTKEYGYHVWGSVINRAGRVCAIAYTGADLTQQFPYGRILSLKLANTANSLSLPRRTQPSHVRHAYPNNHNGLIQNGSGNTHYSTVTPTTPASNAALHDSDLREPDGYDANNRYAGAAFSVPFSKAAVAQPTVNVAAGAGRAVLAENQWFGFTLPAEQTNPGNIDVHYQGATSNYGEACGSTRQDPLCMQKPGGIAYSAGGLALYDKSGVIRGAIGVAGDNDCTNHAIAWKARQQLNLDFTPARASKDERNDVSGFTSTDTDAIAAYRSLQYAKEVFWAGSFAEDNVIFAEQERYNFPKCQTIIQQFPWTNPTQTSTFDTNKK